jgi:nucleotide-binding universal stress UspA family protein
MYRNILIPTDGSALSLKAARIATKLAKQVKAKVTALYVMPAYLPPYLGEASIVYNSRFSEKDYMASVRRHADEATAKVQSIAKAAKVACAAEAAVNRTPWEGIIKAARDNKCDLIVMASHGRRGLAAVLLGSETVKVLTHSKTPVLVCR